MATGHRERNKAAELRRLMARRDEVLAVLHPPTAAHARVMEAAGCEAGFVGTGSVVGGITGLADVGTATMMECVTVAGWIAGAVDFPVIMDGDTGHGGVMAVRRMVRECVRAGLAGLRLDDQPLEGKRRTQDAGIEVAPLDQAIARYRAAVEMRDEIAPDFVIMAQCYARNAENGGRQEALRRLRAYEAAGVDWVQLEAPQSLDEVREARAAVSCAFSFMQGGLDRYPRFDEMLDMGINLAWLPGFTHHVTWAAVWDFMKAFNESGLDAWEDFRESRVGRPYPIPRVTGDGEGAETQARLEARYHALGQRIEADLGKG